MRGRFVAGAVVAGALAVPATVFAHDLLDHGFGGTAPDFTASTGFNAGGKNARWDLITTILTGNPHTDLDFFEQRGETYASAGTLATGANEGGQTIIKLTRRNGNVVDPSFVGGHGSAQCLSNPEASLGLQHDVEAAPKGRTLLGTRNRLADRSDTEVLVDATDANGRCHDQGTLGLLDTTQGGLEIIDVTQPANPVEIGLVSHIGESHTVNVDPKRPHIAYSVTSDAVSVDPETGERANEDPDGGEELRLDGFEVVDMSSCMYFPRRIQALPHAAEIEAKRDRCRPEVFRYRYPSADIALGHTQQDEIYACHELEIYPDDRLTCASGGAMILFDMARAFRKMGTPRDFSDDKPRGQALPCRVRGSTSTGLFTTGARITDCVVGRNATDLSVPGWIDIGSPSLRGVRHLGSAHHQGRGAGGTATPAFDSTEDIDFNHESEFTRSRDFILSTDERGGGVLPPGATCGTSPSDLRAGNGGIHAYRVDRLAKQVPESARQAFRAYARTPSGEKAIYRAQIRTQPQAAFCTSHVFQQIPGQNRIFMGWYSQGTQVVDFVERRNGTFRFKEAGFFIPENANTWVSQVFKVDRNRNGTFTYWGATGDFQLAGEGRNAIDVYKVTLPAPPRAGGRR
jgi:hypothetical protein